MRIGVIVNRFFPAHFDNEYRGHPAALALLSAFLLLKAFASINQVGVNPWWSNRAVLQGIEAVPLGAFGSTEADVALALFAWWGVEGLAWVALGVFALFRYRAMVPLYFLISAATKIADQAIVEASPLTGMLGVGATPPYAAITLLLIGLALSLTPSRRRDNEA